MIEAILILLVSFAWLWRVEWVYQERVKVIDVDYERYKRLPSFVSMALQIWIWDINKFRGCHG
ncbi:hypothetical protein ABEG71_00690 [Duffyella gerundensis]|uniref:hypothetical protein n=1 Tax=Duffyella gerundensis TaxID=1619313 RepID=UPI0016540C7E|nr:hypothetical protein [Duffyella gerundensis]